MPPRRHPIAEAHQFVMWQRTEAGRELRLARLNAGATLRTVADRLGWSKSKISRVERGISARVTVEDLALIGAVVGIRPSIRFYPTGRPVRDIGQLELLAALNSRMSAHWRHAQEVPMPSERDLRAADQLSAIPGCRLMVEAIRRFVDAQAQVRAARLKQRDLGADRLLLLVEATRANRLAIRAAAPELERSFPVQPRAVIAALAAGRDPGGDGILLLARRARDRVVAPSSRTPGRCTR
jgi:transcriptional regulator with XRE-family HTH domain